jgi:gluconate 2-dehydrogenase gamma chain
MSEMSRRQALGVLAALPFATALAPLPEGVDAATADAASRAAEKALAAGPPYTPKFFTPQEWRTVRLLAELVIPRDERSGSATDAGAPEFMDYILSEYPDQQLAVRGGLAWLDAESERRFGTRFVESGGPERTALLNDVAWPGKTRPEMKPGAAFFSRFRDLTAAGFWSSPMGIADLQYRGNTGMAEWTGCPSDALHKLGVSYGG